MRPLQQKLEELEDLLLNHRRTLAQNTGVPFLRLVYRPEEEIDCRRRLETLSRALTQKEIPVETVSCKGVIFSYYEGRGRLEQLFELEREGEERLSANISKHARQEVKDRLLAAAERLPGDGVILLVDAPFVYPYLQLGPVLDDCTNCITAPMALVVLYPAEVDADQHLLFLGKRPSGYYRTRDLV